jgi:hypothetical protein
MNQIEKAIEHLKENPHLIEAFAEQYDAVVPKRVVKFSEEVRMPHYVEYELEIPADVGQDEQSIRAYIQDRADRVIEALEERARNEDWAHVEWAECTGDIQMELTMQRGERRTYEDLGMM